MKNYISKVLFFISLAGIVYAALPLFGRHYIPTHDGEYHIIRIVEFSKMLSAGHLFPRWAPDLNSRYGIPIFNFHYPLPNYIGSFVRMFTRDAVYAFQMSVGLGYIVIAIALYMWLRVLFGTMPALVGALVASFVPYVFVDVYVRGSIGEVWAIALLLLVLYFTETKKYVWLSVAYGLLILSHNILGMIFTPFIIGYIYMRDRKAMPWMLGGIGVSAFFWLPAIVESKYVVGLNTVNFRQHFVDWYQLIIPSWGTGFSGSGDGNAMSVQIGLVPLLVIIGSLFARPKGKYLRLLRYFFWVFLGAVFFMLPISKSLWEVITPLQFIQYPWRLLSFIIPIVGLCAAFWVSVVKKPWFALTLVSLAILLSAKYARPVLYQPRNEAYYMSRSNFTDGTSSMGNSFSTIWTGWKDTRSTESATLYFPGWKAYVSGKEVPIVNDHGVIRAPTGAILKFTETPIRLIADIISILSVVALVLLCVLL